MKLTDERAHRTLAFISYSRKDDREAKRLHRDLETYRLPVGVAEPQGLIGKDRRVRPIFRDTTDLSPTSAPFESALDRELEATRSLIVLCSPNAVESEYVDKEIAHFLATHTEGVANILPIILRGKLEAPDGPDRCLPSSLLPFRQALLGRDLPMAAQYTRLELKLRIVSWLLGIDYAVLHRKHRHGQHRRTAAAALLATLVVALLVGFGAYAAAKKRESVRANELKLEQQLIAERKTYWSQVRLAAQSLEQSEIAAANEALEACAPRLRDWEWGYLRIQIDSSVAQFPCALVREPVAVSRDGSTLAVCRPDGTIELRESNDWSVTGTLGTAGGAHAALAWSADGTRLAAGSNTGHVHVWDVATGAVVSLHEKYDEPVLQLQFVRDGRELLCSSLAGAILRVDVATGQLAGKSLSTVDPAGLFAVDAQEARVAAVNSDGRRLRVFDIESGRVLWERPTPRGGNVVALDWTGDGKWLLIATVGAGAQLVDARDGRRTIEVGDRNAALVGARFTTRESFVGVMQRTGRLDIFEYLPATEAVDDTASLLAHAGSITTFGVLAEDLFASGAADGEVALWVPALGARAGRFRGHSEAVRGVHGVRTAQPGGEQHGTFVSWADDGTVRVWRTDRHLVETGRAALDSLRALREGSVMQTRTVSLDGRRAILRRMGAPAALVTSASSTVRNIEHDDWVSCVCFARDSSCVLTGSRDGTAKLWRSEDGELLQSFAGEGGSIDTCAIDPTASLVLTAGEDGRARIWNVTSGDVVHTLDTACAPAKFAAFDQAGERVVVCGRDGCVSIWSVADGRRVAAIDLGSERILATARFCSGGDELLVVTAAGGVLRVHARTGNVQWALETGTSLADAFITPGAGRLLTVGVEGNVSVWDVSGAEAIISIRLETSQVVSAELLPDGASLRVCGGHGEVFTLEGLRAE